jgi:chromate reductase, NAD(P)H dehydrogenase (quinone)
MTSPTLVAFSGSTRKGSFNSAILNAAVAAARSAGATVDHLDLADYTLPLFNQDLESADGLPEAARELKAKFRAADGFILASPEYNSAFSPLLKNTIDWCSRAESDDEPALAAYAGKSALLLSASPGALGGLRGLYSLRSLLQNIQVTVFPEMLSVRAAHEVMDDNGGLSDEKWLAKIKWLTANYVAFAGKLAGE